MKNTVNQIIKYFETLRFNPKHHLGLGDIRLTIAQQDEIVEIVKHIITKNKRWNHDRQKISIAR
jgi:hypothetical protein